MSMLTFKYFYATGIKTIIENIISRDANTFLNFCPYKNSKFEILKKLFSEPLFDIGVNKAIGYY